MRITIIGATGMAGARIVTEAAARGYRVNAASRRPGTAPLRACQRHRYPRWTYLSPPAILAPGTRTGRYRRGTTTLLTGADGTSRLSVEDLAVAVVDEIEQPGGHRHFTVAEDPAPPRRHSQAPRAAVSR